MILRSSPATRSFDGMLVVNLTLHYCVCWGGNTVFHTLYKIIQSRKCDCMHGHHTKEFQWENIILIIFSKHVHMRLISYFEPHYFKTANVLCFCFGSRTVVVTRVSWNAEVIHIITRRRNWECVHLLMSIYITFTYLKYLFHGTTAIQSYLWLGCVPSGHILNIIAPDAYNSNLHDTSL